MAVLADDLANVDDAFEGNRLLSTFSGEARALIESDASIVELDAGSLVLRHGEQVTVSLFPIGETMVSLSVALSGERSIEVASIGREGAIGGIVSCGQAPAFSRAEVLVGGAALKVPMTALEAAKRRSGFIGNLFCRYSDFLLSQVMQSVACNAFHSINQRAARWLLHAQDRAGDRLELTQEALAGMLGVQRTTVNAVIRDLHEQGSIMTGRGVVHIIDRTILERQACECYESIERHFANVIGGSGSGGN